MGTATGDLVVNLKYPLAFAKAFANASVENPSTAAKKFKFVFLVERWQNKIKRHHCGTFRVHDVPRYFDTPI